MQMMAMQQQFQMFMQEQAVFKREMYENQARASTLKSKADPPKFGGKANEDLELWIFYIEEHFSAFAAERTSNDSRFVDMVVPALGADVMSWHRKFKNALGNQPRTWENFKAQIFTRFCDSDFEFKLLTKLYELRITGTQQEYTSKLMLLLSQSSIEMPEIVMRWFYQQNLRADQ